MLDLSFDENDGREFSLILFSFSKECRMRESSSIRAHLGPPGHLCGPGWVAQRAEPMASEPCSSAARADPRPSARGTLQPPTGSRTPLDTRLARTGSLSARRGKSHRQRFHRRQWKAYRLADPSAGYPRWTALLPRSPRSPAHPRTGRPSSPGRPGTRLAWPPHLTSVDKEHARMSHGPRGAARHAAQNGPGGKPCLCLFLTLCSAGLAAAGQIATCAGQARSRTRGSPGGRV